MILKNAVIYNDRFEQENTDIAIEGEKISAIGRCVDGENIDLTGCTIVPGFIDIHIHGCAGHDTSDATPEGLEAMSHCLAERGVTSFCPTSMTMPYDSLRTVFANVQSCMDKVSGAYIHGIHMEGPYIAPAKKGAQNAAYIRSPDADAFRQLYDSCGGNIRLVVVAPEYEIADEFIRATEPYCPVSIAHTAANYDQVMHAFDSGVRHVTHLYNAMNGLTHREPGVVGAVFDAAQQYGVRAELICDGFHIHPAALRIAFRMLGEDNSIIVSDSMCAAGHKDGEYQLGGQTVYVRDGKAMLADGTISASTTNLYDEFRNVLRYGIPFRQALKSLTINPARAIRVDDVTGSLTAGKNADLLVLDKDLNLKLVMVKGQIKVNKL